MRKNFILLLSCFAGILLSAKAEEKKASKNENTVVMESLDLPDLDTLNVAGKKKWLKRGDLSISGSIDAYYQYNLNNPGAEGNGGISGVGRIFDLEHNRFAFGMVRSKIAYETDKTEIVGELAFGPAGELANFGNTGTGILIKQAYLSHYLTDKFSFTFGQFGTHIGYELVDAPDNFHYSLSYLFGNGPFYHTGLKLQYDFSDKISLMAGVVNGWDNISDNNKAKSVVAQLAVAPTDNFEFYLNWIGGNEDDTEVTGDSLKSYKQMVDLTTTYSVTDAFSLGLNAAFGTYKFGDASAQAWGGVALYAGFELSDLFALGARIEYFDDDRGVQYLGDSYTGYTLTGVFKLADGAIQIKPEIRHDRTNRGHYFSDATNLSNGNGDMNLKKSQTTFGIAFIGAF